MGTGKEKSAGTLPGKRGGGNVPGVGQEIKRGQVNKPKGVPKDGPGRITKKLALKKAFGKMGNDFFRGKGKWINEISEKDLTRF